MKLEWRQCEDDGRKELYAEPGDYDGVPPVRSFVLDKEPLFYNNDVLAVVGVLLFGEYVSGWVTTPRPVSPEVAEAIQEFLSPAWTGVSPVDFEPKGNALGEGTLFVSTSLSSWGHIRSEWGKPRTSTLCVLSASQFAGHLASPDGLVVASNGNLLGQLSRRKSPSFPAIAAGALFCETYRASSIALDFEDDLSDEEFHKLYNLLASCKISLKRMEKVAPVTMP